MTGPDDVVVPLTEDAAWEFLRTQELGRLAFHLLGEVHLVPINYTAIDRRVLVRTAPGSKLLGVVMDQDVAFEVDEVDARTATSVVLRGTASLLDDAEADDARRIMRPSWVPTDKDEVVAIDVTEIAGRSFVLDRREASRSA